MQSRIRLSGCAPRAQSQAAQPAPSEGRKTRNRDLTCPNEIAELSARYSKDFLKAGPELLGDQEQTALGSGRPDAEGRPP